MTTVYFARRLTALVLAVSMLGGCFDWIKGLFGGKQGLPEGAEPYAIPAFMDSVFDENAAQTFDSLSIDTSHLSQGYAAVRAKSDSRIKFQVTCGEMTYTYDLDPTGETAIIPMNMGEGEYTFRLMENVGDNRYACLWKDSCSVVPEDEFQCFLRPSQLVNYTEDSECAKLARELAANCETDTDVAAAIYQYLVKHISYDHDKAATVQTGYLPNPDDTLASKKGICFDYASLAAAMMRSLGIPCKLITGYVDSSLYHAWNTFYTKEQGWVTVEIKATPNLWQRVDITMAAGGTSTRELTDDTKYTTRFTY